MRIPFGPRTLASVWILPSTPLSLNSRAFQPKLQMLAAVSAMAPPPGLVGPLTRVAAIVRLVDLRRRLGKALDDAQVSIGRFAEHFQRRLIAFALVRGYGFIDAVEFDHDDALGNPRLVGLCRVAACQKASAGGSDCRTRELGVGSQCIWIGN